MLCFTSLSLFFCFVFFFNDTATTEIYTYLHTLSLHDALPISSILSPIIAILKENLAARAGVIEAVMSARNNQIAVATNLIDRRSEEHTSELQSLMRISYAVFCLKKKINNTL